MPLQAIDPRENPSPRGSETKPIKGSMPPKTLIDKGFVEEAKNYPVRDLWGRLGLPNLPNVGNVKSPWREDGNPSVEVGGPKNIVFDHGSKESLDSIKLVRKVRNCSFSESIEWIIGKPLFQDVNLPVAAYNYRDSNGEILYRKDKYISNGQKFFCFFHKNGAGWSKGRGENQPVLYNLPAVFTSVQAGATIFVVEGEKDVDSLFNLGMVATSNDNGAGHWRDEFSQVLAGARVIIIPDHDEAGRTHCRVVGQSLSRHGRAGFVCSLPGLPDHGDVTDWMNQGHSKQELLDEIDRSIPFSEWLASQSPGTPPEVQGKPQEETLSTVEWESPRPLPKAILSPVLVFDSTIMLPSNLRAYVDDIAERMQCPKEFVAVPLLIALASIVGKKVVIKPKAKDDWIVVPNLWGMTISRPGLLKSPSQKAALKPIEELDERARELFKQQMLEYEKQLILAKAKKAVLETDLRTAVKNDEDTDEILNKMMELPSPPTQRRYLVNISSEQKLRLILSENHTTLVGRDELSGLLRMLDDENYQTYRSYLLEIWSGHGGGYDDTISRGTIHGDGICSLYGSIQPGPLLGYFETGRDSTGGKDNGFLQRLQLAVWPDISPDWKQIDRPPNHHAYQKVIQLFEKVDSWPAANQQVVRFSPDAQTTFDDWYRNLEVELRGSDEPDSLISHWSKYRSLIPSISLLLELADNPDATEVTPKSLGMGLEWERYLRSHARRIYGSSTNLSLLAARSLLKHILDEDLGDSFTARQVYRNQWTGLRDRNQVELAAELLGEYGWLREVEVQTNGRPKVEYQVNPKSPRNTGKPTDKTVKSPSLPPSVSFDSPLPESFQTFEPDPKDPSVSSVSPIQEDFQTSDGWTLNEEEGCWEFEP